MKGQYVIVAVQPPKAYDFQGNTGVARKITIRNEAGEAIEVKADTDFDFKGYLDKKVTVTFEIKKGGILKAVSCV